ncbi:MAG: phosphoribosylamine--glycine ligase [Actinomycetota bacterium]
MRVLVVGGGGREHALTWGLSRSPQFTELHAVPGNAGIARLATCHPVKAEDLAGLVALAERLAPDLVVIGPEAPLVAGLSDALRDRGVAAFGPDAAAARLEGSKAFAKEVMARGGIPTAVSGTFTSFDEAAAFVDGLGGRAVVKADGLAAGKGDTVANDRETALAALRDCLQGGAFGEAGATVVVEEILEGPEVSAFALSDGKTVVPLVLSQDFKRVGDGDAGPNTGGMGAYSPLPWIDDAVERQIWDLCRRTVETMGADGLTYRGLLYTGLMLTSEGPKVLEYNCRFGDPETEVVIPRLGTDLADLLLAAATEGLADVKVDWTPDAAVTVMIASGGYPGAYRTGVPIDGLDAADEVEGAVVFHAGTAEADGRVVTSGGRVLSVTGLGATIGAARATAYDAASRIRFEGSFHRTDIAARAAEGE